MDENKFDFEKHFKKLENHTENFEVAIVKNNDKVTENNEKIAIINEESDKTRNAINAYNSYYEREEPKNQDKKRELQKKIEVLTNKIIENDKKIIAIEEENKGIEELNKKLEIKGQEKKQIIGVIINVTTREFNEYKEEKEKETQTEIEKNNAEIEKLEKQISVMDEIGNKNNRVAQQKVLEKINRLKEENKDIERVAKSELLKLQIEFKRKINEKYLNSEEIGKILKEKAIEEPEEEAEPEEPEEVTELEEPKDEEEELEEPEDEEEELEEPEDEVAEPEELEDEEEELEEPEDEEEELEEPEDEEEELEEPEDEVAEPEELEEEVAELEEPEEEIAEIEKPEKEETEQVKPKRIKEEEIIIKARRNSTKYIVDGETKNEVEAILSRNEKKYLYEDLDIDEKVEDVLKAAKREQGNSKYRCNKFKIWNAKRKLDPSIIKLLKENESLLMEYMYMVCGEVSDGWFKDYIKLEYDLRYAHEKEIMNISKYAKYSASAIIKGELLSSNIFSRAIRGIKRTFSKIQRLGSRRKVEKLYENNEENYSGDSLEHSSDRSDREKWAEQYKNYNDNEHNYSQEYRNDDYSNEDELGDEIEGEPENDNEGNSWEYKD